jgi:hypothetical protein
VCANRGGWPFRWACDRRPFTQSVVSAILAGMAEIAKPRWFHLTPDRLILGLLAFPGELSTREPQIGLKYDPEYLGAWTVQKLGWEE